MQASLTPSPVYTLYAKSSPCQVMVELDHFWIYEPYIEWWLTESSVGNRFFFHLYAVLKFSLRDGNR
jgi:hypothetical protein